VPDAAVPLGPADLDACLELDRQALGGLWTPNQWSSELSDARRPCLGIRAGTGLLAIACGWLVADELHVTAVAVDPQQRRRGMGSQVLRALLREAAGEGALHATLEVAAGNTAAQALYAAAGFQTAGVRRAYYRNGDDALIQWLRLRDGEGIRITDLS
jgi:[ribosomal protein S18]-alanine N-acetyltransferase